MPDLPITYRGVVSPWQCDHMYKRELRAGDVVSIRSGVLEIREKVIRFFHEMYNDETGEIAATAEMTGVHLDTVLRKSCPFPGKMFERAGALIAPGGRDA